MAKKSTPGAPAGAKKSQPPPRPLYITQPDKKFSELTDEEIREWAGQVVDAFIEKEAN